MNNLLDKRSGEFIFYILGYLIIRLWEKSIVYSKGINLWNNFRNFFFWVFYISYESGIKNFLK